MSSPPTPTASAIPEPSSDTFHTVQVDLTKLCASDGTRICGFCYRSRHCAQLAGWNKISWFFDPGADCEDTTGTRLWVYKYYYSRGSFRDEICKFTGTNAADSHRR